MHLPQENTFVLRTPAWMLEHTHLLSGTHEISLDRSRSVLLKGFFNIS
jgi:hypothetical protein